MLELAVTAVVLSRTASEQNTPLLACGRGGCVAVCGVISGAGFLGLLPPWAFAVACVACLLGVLAVALRYGQGPSLRVYLDTRGDAEEPPWWPAFERSRRYASTPRREQNPLRRAVTRPRAVSTIPDRDRVAGRHPDVPKGGRL